MRRLVVLIVAMSTLLIPMGPAAASDPCSLPEPLTPEWCE